MSTGVAISTYNRQDYLQDLLDTLPFDRVDHVVVVKDGGHNYNFVDDRVEYVELAGNHGVATSKNFGLALLLKAGVEHIFLLDDDVIIKNDDVFDAYINTANHTGIHHLLFSKIDNNNINYTDNTHIDLHARCCGAFMYMHSGVVKHVGDFDQRFVNAYEHIDFYYRCEHAGLVPKFWWFPDMHKSDQYLMDHPHNKSTISGSPQYNNNVSLSTNHFVNKHKHHVNQIPFTDLNHVLADMKRIKANYSR